MTPTYHTGAEVMARLKASRRRLADSLVTMPIEQVRETQIRISVIDETLAMFAAPKPETMQVGRDDDSSGYA